MIKTGEYQILEISREMPQGYYLVDEENEEEVLFPQSYITEDMEIGDKIEVFVYCDSDDRDVATTERPYLTVGEFASLEVMNVNDTGAFCDWGVTKELLIPFSNQAFRLKTGMRCVVYMYLDPYSDRLVGTTKLGPFLKNNEEQKLAHGQEVSAQIFQETELGYKVVIDQEYLGLIYKNELHKPLVIGSSITAYIKPLRPDFKIDVSLNPIGYKSIGANEQVIVNKLKKANGFLPFNDKSDPGQIRETFGFSKKLFKKVIGSLYKQRLIEINEKGIELINKNQ